MQPRPSRSKTLVLVSQAALLVFAAMPLAPSADAGLVLCPAEEAIRIFISRADATTADVPDLSVDEVTAYISREVAHLSQAQASSSGCDGGGGGDPYPTPTPCPSQLGLVVEWDGLVNTLCVETPPGSLLCVHENLNGGTDNQLCADYPPGGIVCVSDYHSGAAVSRTCVDYIASGKPCLSHYMQGTVEATDRTCLDDGDNGLMCVSNYWGNGDLNARLCPEDQDESGHLCPTLYESGRQAGRACADDDGDPDHPCATTYANGVREDRACLEPDGADVCVSNTAYALDWSGDRLTGCLDQSEDGETGHACAKVHYDGIELDRACNDPEEGLILCGSDYVLGATAGDRTCVGEYPEGFCASNAAFVSGVLVEDRACTTEDVDGDPCVSNTVYLGASPLALAQTCRDPAFPEDGTCMRNRVEALGNTAETLTCRSTDPETQQPCLSTTVYVNGVQEAAPSRCGPTRSDCEEGEVGQVVDGDRYCEDHPCPDPQGSLDLNTVSACGSGPACPDGVGPDLNTVSACGSDPVCPDGVGPDLNSISVCGSDPACPGGPNPDLDTVSVCGSQPVCPTGLQGSPGPDEFAVVCGVPVPNPCAAGIDQDTLGICDLVAVCPTGVQSPPGPNEVAVICGIGIPKVDPCPTPVGNPGPGQLAVICGQPIDHPCEQGVDEDRLDVCGLVAICPTGVQSPPGPDQTAVVCGIGIPKPDDPCPGLVAPGGPGQLVVVCGNPVPCEAGVDPMTGRACVAGPVCPDGVVDPGQPGEVCGNPPPCPEPVTLGGPDGQLAVVCGEDVEDPRPEGVLPECMDGKDNDGDGRTDFSPPTLGGGDAQCGSHFDVSEGA